jgi:CBS-domain-containing membrane protein
MKSEKISVLRSLLLQTTILFLFVSTVIYILRIVSDSILLSTLGGGALASTAFIVLISPRCSTARFSHVIGSYVVAMLSGMLLHFVLTMFILPDWPQFQHVLFSGAAAFSVVLTMLGMVFFRVSHPPAMGLAYGVVIDEWLGISFLVIISSVLAICLIRKLFKQYLIDFV